MAKGNPKDNVLYRTQKWELVVTPVQEQLLLNVREALREIYNWGHAAWMAAYEQYREEKKTGEKPTTKIPTLFDQINLLTELGEQDRQEGLFRAQVPRNWKEETLDALYGGLSSFFALIKKGDQDARPPRVRNEHYFCAIPGRSGFSIKKGHVVLAPNIFGKETLMFPVPQEYQAVMLGRATKIKKFTISRDESYLRRKGRYWIEVSYEILKPDAKPFVPEKAVYVALGSWAIGVVSPKGEEVIKFERPDVHWKPKIDDVGIRTKMLLEQGKLTKGSRKYERQMRAYRKMNRVMGSQQKLNRRTVVSADLVENTVGNLVCGHGVHFVVSDLVVRSKEGKLADAAKPERGGQLGLNWSAQNTGAIAYLVQWLEEKAKEQGGTVRKHRLPLERIPCKASSENKIAMAYALRDDFLRSLG